MAAAAEERIAQPQRLCWLHAASRGRYDDAHAAAVPRDAGGRGRQNELHHVPRRHPAAPRRAQARSRNAHLHHRAWRKNRGSLLFLFFLFLFLCSFFCYILLARSHADARTQSHAHTHTHASGANVQMNAAHSTLSTVTLASLTFGVVHRVRATEAMRGHRGEGTDFHQARDRALQEPQEGNQKGTRGREEKAQRGTIC